MKHSAPLFLLCFACGPSADLPVSSSDLKETKKTDVAMLSQPTSDPDDAELLSPDRERIAEVVGEPVEPAAVAGFFADGSGDWALGAAPRTLDEAPLELVRFIRKCNKITGCTPWIEEIVVLSHSLLLSASNTGELTLTQRAKNGDLLTEAKLTASQTPVTLAAHVLDDMVDTRRVLVDLRDGSITIETLIRERPFNGEDVTEQWGWSMQFRNDLTAQPPRAEANKLPEVKHSTDCAQAPATQAELVAWFQPGQTSVDFPQGENFSWARKCHALTGCTPWTADDKAALLSKLVVKGGAIQVQSSSGGLFKLTDSAFKSDTANITVGAGCAKGNAKYSVDGEHHNHVERFESGVSNRGSAPGGA